MSLQILRKMKKKLGQENRSFCPDLNLDSAEHEAGLLAFEWRSLVISCNQFLDYRVFMIYGSPIVSTEMRRSRFPPAVRDSALWPWKLGKWRVSVSYRHVWLTFLRQSQSCVPNCHHHHHHHHHKHQRLDPLIRSVSRVTAARANASSVFQLFSFLMVCSGMISKGFGFVAFFASVKASSVSIQLSCLVCL